MACDNGEGGGADIETRSGVFGVRWRRSGTGFCGGDRSEIQLFDRLGCGLLIGRACVFDEDREAGALMHVEWDDSGDRRAVFCLRDFVFSMLWSGQKPASGVETGVIREDGRPITIGKRSRNAADFRRDSGFCYPYIFDRADLDISQPSRPACRRSVRGNCRDPRTHR